jgi:hypothetical protein
MQEPSFHTGVFFVRRITKYHINIVTCLILIMLMGGLQCTTQNNISISRWIGPLQTIRLDIFTGHMIEKWNIFMKDHIKRTCMFFLEAKKGVMELDEDSCWPIWAHNSYPWLWTCEIMQLKFQDSWIVFLTSFVACVTHVNISCPCFTKLSNQIGAWWCWRWWWKGT